MGAWAGAEYYQPKRRPEAEPPRALLSCVASGLKRPSGQWVLRTSLILVNNSSKCASSQMSGGETSKESPVILMMRPASNSSWIS